MEITRVKIGVCDGADRVKADASMTLDHSLSFTALD